LAKTHGVTVNVLSIKGTDCSLEYLGRVATVTRGYNNVVDPLELEKDFNCILQNKIIATDVEVKMLLPQGLQFRQESNVKGLCAHRSIGNVTKESAITFEFCEAATLDKDQHKGFLPFQVQIFYTKLDGAKCGRFISRCVKLTQSRDEAEKAVNVKVVGMHAVQKASKLAQQGNYTKARMTQLTTNKLLQRAAQSSTATEKQKQEAKKFAQEAQKMEDALFEVVFWGNTKHQEISKGLRYHSEDEDRASDQEVDGETEKHDDSHAPFANVSMNAFRSKARQMNRNDLVSNVIFQQENPMYSKFSAT